MQPDARVAASSPGAPSPGVAFTATLVLAMGAGPLVVYAISALSPLLREDLALDAAQLGVLATLAFLTAVPLSFVAARFANSVGERVALVSLFAFAAVALTVVATARGFGWLAAASVLSAVPQAVSNPLTNRLVAEHVVAGQRGALIGIKQSGVQVAQVSAGLLLPTSSLLFGWRGSVALLAAGMAVISAVGMRTLPRRERAVLIGPVVTPSLPVSRPVWLLAGYTALMGACLQATHVPLAAHTRLEFNPRSAGLLVALIGAAGLVARIWWGRYADRIDRPVPILTTLAVLSAAGSLLLLTGLSTALPQLVWIAALVHGSAALPATVVVVVTMLRWTSVEQVGRASAVLAVGLFTGFAAGPVSFGVLYEISGSYETAWTVVAGGFFLAALLVQGLRTEARR
jgi:predicted MFS family arabinose efflux permease